MAAGASRGAGSKLDLKTSGSMLLDCGTLAARASRSARSKLDLATSKSVLLDCGTLAARAPLGAGSVLALPEPRPEATTDQEGHRSPSTEESESPVEFSLMVSRGADACLRELPLGAAA